MKDHLKKRRKELGLTLEQVGESVGVGKSTVRRWENGLISNMRSDKVNLLAKALKVPTEFILSDSEVDSDYISAYLDYNDREIIHEVLKEKLPGYSEALGEITYEALELKKSEQLLLLRIIQAIKDVDKED